VLISESHSDSNWCTPCRGKLDQHDTYFPRSVRIWPLTIRISRGLLSWEEWLPTQSTAWRLTDPQVCTQLLSQNSQWSSGKKSSICWQPATMLTRLISLIYDNTFNTCSRRPTYRSLIDPSGGLQPWRCRFTTHHSPTFPTSGLYFSSKGPDRSLI
jgi:hypothetical protein